MTILTSLSHLFELSVLSNPQHPQQTLEIMGHILIPWSGAGEVVHHFAVHFPYFKSRLILVRVTESSTLDLGLEIVSRPRPPSLSPAHYPLYHKHARCWKA